MAPHGRERPRRRPPHRRGGPCRPAGAPRGVRGQAAALRLYPLGCLALARDGRVAGYAFSHPWRLGDAPALDVVIDALPASPDCYYLHDLALSPEARGRGAAAAGIGALERQATSEGLRTLALICVHGTGDFWTRAGFRDAPDPRLAAKLASYGPGARYMTKTIAGEG